MIFTNTIAENENMDEAISYQDEHLAHNEKKSTYPKRSNVVELWKKKEGSIKSSNTVSKEKSSKII